MTQAQQITDPIDAQLEAKYRAELQALAAYNFKDMMQMHEKAFPYSAIALFYLYPMMKMSGEVFRVENPLRYVILYPVVVNRQYATFAAVFSKGVTFSTAFSDGTVLASANFKTNEINKPDKQVYRFAPGDDVSIEDAWSQHLERYQELLDDGLEPAADLSLEKFERIVQRIQSVAGL